MSRRNSSDIREPKFECLICGLEYDETKHIPMTLCPSQHGFCSDCIEHKLFKDKGQGETILCPECKHSISKSQVKKFIFLHQIRQTSLKLKNQGSHQKEEHSLTEEGHNIEEQVLKLRQQNDWLIQQYLGMEVKFKNLEDVHKQNQTALESRIKADQSSLERLSQQLWEVKGDEIFTQSKVIDVIEFCQSIIKTGPKHDYHTFGLGNIEDQIGRYEGNVFEWYNNFKTVHKIMSSPYDVLSLCYSFTRNYPESIEWYNSRLSKNHDSYQLLLGLANVLYNSGKYSEAEKIYLRVIEIKPQLDKPYQQIAFIKALKQGKKEEARKWIEKAKAKNSSNFYVQYIFAISEENPDVQIEKLTKLSETMKQYVRIYNGLGNAYKLKKEYDQAAKAYKKAIEINPKFFSAYYGLGVLYTLQSKYDEAINWFHQSIKINHHYDKAYYGLASVFTKKNENDEAIKWHKLCLQINPNFISSLNGLGILLAGKEHYEQAIHYFSKCIEINPNYDFAYNGLGNVYYHTGKYDEAIQSFIKCIEINPKNGAPYNGLSNIYSKKGDQAEAKIWYDKKMAAISSDE